jgi:hypothetical protein
MSEMRKSAFSESYESDSSGIGLTVQHLVKGMSNMTVQELEHLRDSVNAELSYMVVDRTNLGSGLSDPKSPDPNQEDLGSGLSDPKFPDPNQEDLGSGLSDPKSPDPNQEDLGSGEKIYVPLGNVEYKPLTKNGRTYFYYYWRYWGKDGSHKSKYLSSSRTRAISKVERIGIPPDAQRY